MPGDEEWLRPSRQLLAMRRAELALVAVVLAAIVFVIFLANNDSTWGAVSVGVVFVVGLLVERMLRRRFASWGYLERSGDLLVRRGVLFQRLTVVPYGRMQLVDVSAGAVERVFGLQTVHLHTAAAATDARIPGLEPKEASRLRDQLAALGEAQAAGI